MTITLTPELAAYAATQVASGAYQSVEEVIDEAFWALRVKERRARRRAVLVQELEDGIAECERGKRPRWTSWRFWPKFGAPEVSI